MELSSSPATFNCHSERLEVSQSIEDKDLGLVLGVNTLASLIVGPVYLSFTSSQTFHDYEQHGEQDTLKEPPVSVF